MYRVHQVVLSVAI